MLLRLARHLAANFLTYVPAARCDNSKLMQLACHLAAEP